MPPSFSALTIPGSEPARAKVDARIALIAWLGERRAGLSISAAIHALLLVAAGFVFPVPIMQAPRPESLSVELITPPPLATLARPKSLVAPSPRSAAPAPAVPEKLVLSHARTILSGGALDRVASASLKTLADDARFEQLCGIEAMEQIARSKGGFNPERTIAYATADTQLENDTLTAEGAAFLSEGRWYHLAFNCRASRDRQKIVSFDFATGAEFAADDPALPTGASD